MTDLEMVTKCALKRGYVVEDTLGNLVRASYEYRTFSYDPLHDDAQAMALVKEMNLDIIWLNGSLKWRVYCFPDEEKTQALNHDLNRAIVECVSKL